MTKLFIQVRSGHERLIDDPFSENPRYTHIYSRNKAIQVAKACAELGGMHVHVLDLGNGRYIVAQPSDLDIFFKGDTMKNAIIFTIRGDLP